MRTFAQFRAGRHETGRELACEYVFAPRIPTLVELSAVGVNELLRRLMWRVTGAWRKPEEEGLVGICRARIVDEEHCFVGHVFGEVVSLLW